MSIIHSADYWERPDHDIETPNADLWCSNCHWLGDDDEPTVGVLIDDGEEVLQPERCPQCGSQQLLSVGEQS